MGLFEQQDKVQIRKELWRIEDVIAGLSTSKANYKVTISSLTNPGETPGAFTCKKPEISSRCNAVQATWSCCCISPLKLLIIYSILMTWTFPRGKESPVFTALCVFTLRVHVHGIPREEVCAFSVGVVSAFCAREPVCCGDETVAASAASAASAAQPSPQPQRPQRRPLLQPQPAALPSLGGCSHL